MVILYKRIKFSLWPENHVVDTKYDTFSRCIDLDSQNPWPDMSGVIDHKWAGILKLRIKGTDRHIVLVNTHLVTDTRDAAYPGTRLPIDEGLDPSSGRNKRWEFRWLLHYLTSYIYRGDIRPSDAIILGGDLNTKYRVAPGEIYGDRDIFGNQFNGAIGLTSERAIDVLASHLKKWDEKKAALSQGLRQIGYEPRGTEKSRSERTVVSSDERSDSAIERFNLCQTEMERMKFSDTEMKKRMAESVKRISDLDRKLSDLEGMEAKLRCYEKELELNLAKTELHLSYTTYIGLIVVHHFGDYEDVTEEDRNSQSYRWARDRLEFMNSFTLPPLIERVDRLCGISERKKFMRVILDNTLAASQSPHPYENGSIFHMYARTHERMLKLDFDPFPNTESS